MQAKLLVVFGLAAMLLQACAEKPVEVTRVQEPADEYGHAAKCEVDPNPVEIPSKLAGPIEVKMTVGNDGGWCAVRLKQVKSAVLRAEPQHGTPYFRNVRDITRLQYTPAAGYTGPDGFTFQLLPSGATIHTTVTVTGP